MTKRSKTAKADIKIRLTEALRSKVERAARQGGVSMNAEMIERLERSFEWEQARTTAQAWLAENRDVIKGDFEATLRLHGYTSVAMLPRGQMWASPDADLSPINLAIDAKQVANDMLPDLIQALARALGKFAKKGEQS